MMKSIIFAVLVLGICLPATYSRHVQFYRKDYTYIEAFDAFYKVHWDLSGLTWHSAFSTCDDEGASLFYPKARGEWTLVKNLTDQMTEAPNVTDIFVGFHDEFQLGEFITVDGQTTPYPLPGEDSPWRPLHNHNCITMNIDTGLFRMAMCLTPPDTPLPFVCKKVDDVSCPTIDRGYKYVKTSRKCYKVNEKLQNWQKAMKTCFMEGGILAVVENSAQAQEIRDMVIQGESYFVGIKKLFSNDYYSVKGQKFSDLYHRQFSNNDYECGTVKNADNMFLYTDAASCDSMLPFICEMEVAI